MPRKSISFELDFMTKDILPKFTVKQFDDISFDIKPKNQGLDYDTTGMTGKIFIGVNNDMFMQTKNITVSNNNVNILLDRNMLQKNGRAYAEVELTDSNGTITSSSFIFNIDEKIGEGAKIPGEYEGFVAKYERLISEFKAQVNSTIDNCNTNINSTINNCNKAVDNKLNDVDNFVDNKILDIEKRFNTLTSSQQQESEVIDARDGEVSLKARLDRDLYKDGISLSDRIEAIEGLKDSQNMKYETDKGYLVCKETKNGVIDDLKIEGKTLVNLCQFKDTQFTLTTGQHYDDLFICYTDNLKLNTNYTFMYDIEITSNTTSAVLGTNVVNQFGVSSSDIETTTNHPSMKINGITEITMSQLKNHNRALIQFIDFKGYKALRLRPVMPPIRPLPEGQSITYKVKNMMLLEGDHTQNPPSYFEGLMSVGEDVDKIEVLSNSNGIIFNESAVNEDWLDGLFDGGNPNSPFISSKAIYIRGFKHLYSYYLYNNTLNVATFAVFFNKDKQKIGSRLEGIKLNQKIEIPLDAYYVRLMSFVGSNTYQYTKFIASTMPLTVEDVKEVVRNKKQILFYNENGELESIQELHEWDSIEKHSDNKWYYHKRSGKRSYQTEDENNSNYITDMTNTVYQLAEEEVYELAPLHLDSYANETLILCNSGAISPKMEFSITSHINELVKAYGERVNLLEEKVYQYMVTQNRMQLASTYSADSVTFKVDYALCSEEVEYNEDLYNLILNNILVGKDNYDYDKMFTMILDYASWNQISWEQFDILVGLMDIQHNPPIEETPTDDEIVEETPNEIM